ncbi:hypothetical protein M758_5G053600 [Ceratodon purpureus]|nr:hypothetical protein M758_5G053600 [Ceratodon purpureus]
MSGCVGNIDFLVFLGRVRRLSGSLRIRLGDIFLMRETRTSDKVFVGVHFKPLLHGFSTPGAWCFSYITRNSSLHRKLQTLMLSPSCFCIQRISPLKFL